MSRIAWNQVGERFFETGVNQGVFYPPFGGSGVPWTGLIAVNETPDGGDSTPYYLDGIKFLDTPNPEEFSGSIEALSHPKEFAMCDGQSVIGSMLSIGQQPRRPFGFSYRTILGNDISGIDAGYKIHLVYNALVAPSSKTYNSISDSPDPMHYSWEFTTTPIPITGHKPSAHLAIDSSNAAVIAAIEDIVYGSATTAPRLPTPAEVIALLM